MAFFVDGPLAAVSPSAARREHFPLNRFKEPMTAACSARRRLQRGATSGTSSSSTLCAKWSEDLLSLTGVITCAGEPWTTVCEGFCRPQTAAPEDRQILSLGAGFDSLFFRLHADALLDRASVFELDFPDVAHRKAALISSSEPLKERLDCFSPPLPGPIHLSSSHYQLVGVDLRDQKQVEAALRAAGMDWAAPTLILSEVVLTYMETQRSDAIISWAAKLLPQSLFVMYEQVRPHDPFGCIMQEHFLKMNSPLHALTQYPDISAQRQRFLDKGWQQSMCLDMNQFYFGLVSEEERDRVESLEPFDEYEEWHQKCSHYFILTASAGALMDQALLVPRTKLRPSPVASPGQPPSSVPSCRARPIPTCVEGLGMASSCLWGGYILLTGGISRTGRGAETRVLLRDQEGWSMVCTEQSAGPGMRLHHSATPLPGGAVLLYGGRSSPLRPVTDLLRVSFQPCSPALGAQKIQVEPLTCTGDSPPPRWRHTAAAVRHRDRDFLFVFGGKNQSERALGDIGFLCLDDLHWTQVPVEGVTPAPRHSHSACSYEGGVLVFGGLGEGGAPLGDISVLGQTERGFCWERIDVHPPPEPRYSHRAHVVGQKLLVVGGVWMFSEGVPGLAVIDLATCTSVEFSLDTASVPHPLMLHSFCSELTASEEPELLLMGGGGNCFSFGTHWNRHLVSVELPAVLTLSTVAS
ncbi:tRNA wybutosine-synthesizing protein 4 isoform X1 [Oryzias melastigma]|uniref:tRNA wybutosine-synthesizing protein 4 isoform X1 n=2 Tax=Oryzias melastigma TaxID=30732 RepID=UPI00168CE005|nr:tRNA wybutosine-synthesizing protein 4 isoform X1 [Oryzias melastigma]